MKRASLIRVLASGLLLGCVIVVGCKDKEDPATVPVPSGEPATTAAAPAPTTSTTEDPAASASASATAAPPPVAGTGAAVPHKGESIDACCNALRAVAKSGKTSTAKAKAASAAAVCPGIAKLVKDGTTSRSAGLSQIRSALTGYDVPGECR